MKINFLNFKLHSKDELFIEEELKRFTASSDFPQSSELISTFSFENGIFQMENWLLVNNENLYCRISGRDPKILASSSIIELKMSLLKYNKTRQDNTDLLEVAI